MQKPFYITTTLPYVNADPHIGFAMEIIRADVIARYRRSLDEEVFFNTGTDEHGAKIFQNATKEGVSVQTYVDGYAAKFKDLIQALNIEYVHFIRTTDAHHISAAQEMWKRCCDNGYIYKKNYQTKYCVGCELTKTDSELVHNTCPLHPNREIELIDEENYFFAWSKFSGRGHKDSLLDFYDAHPDFVIPDFRFNEIKSFVERGLEDFSISRLQEKMPWGVPVPGDSAHVMYVWFDALTSYISTLGWPDETGNFKFWKEGSPIQYCGKDNLRQQSAMWQSMLMASGIPNSTRIVINGFITGPDGQKMSKSLGNVISPIDVIKEFKEVTDYPEDVLRFVLLHDISSFEDGSISLEMIKDSYQAHLANGIGNLTNRIMKMIEVYGEELRKRNLTLETNSTIYPDVLKEYNDALESYDIKKAIEVVMRLVSKLDEKIQLEEAFKIIKQDFDKGTALIVEQYNDLSNIAKLLAPFLPRTSAKILECIRENKMPEKPLFNRLP